LKFKNRHIKIKVAPGLLLTLLIVFMVFPMCAEDNPEIVEPPEEELPMDSVPNPPVDMNPVVDYNLWEIKDGKFYLDGEWKFLKIAKPLRDFSSATAVNQLIADLDILRDKYYNTIELNCYWHHFDMDGDGEIDKSLAPLNKLINAIYEKGMYPCLSVETYSVGGGQIPKGFWSIYPDAYAIDDKGNKVKDTEYGFGTNVVSIFHPGYRETVHKYIKNLAEGVDTKKILYFETTVEPQYMGSINLCYSENARTEYKDWRKKNNITDKESEMSDSFPISSSFITNITWNKFRVQFLAKWINDDAAAYREIAGEDAYIQVDYLDAGETEQVRRDGNPIEFLTHLTAANIIQINWTWYFPTNTVNQKAYDRVWEVIDNTGRDWAVSEHMTFNGSDFMKYASSTLNKILLNTFTQGTRFGWEFVNVGNSTNDSFALYKDDWSAKRVINSVDEHWGYWLYKAGLIEKQTK
jgi:hypothetical protein